MHTLLNLLNLEQWGIIISYCYEELNVKAYLNLLFQFFQQGNHIYFLVTVFQLEFANVNTPLNDATTFSVMTLGVLTLSIVNQIVTIRINNIQHNNNQHAQLVVTC
jgi:hypothetical protein